LTVRVFAALELPPEQQQHLVHALAALRDAVPSGAVRWLPAESLHLTLKFYGDLERSRLPAIQAGLARAAAGAQPVEAEMMGIGAFPSARRPNVVWVGLAGHLEPLHALHAAVEAAAREAGFEPEGRPFHPHVTVGRVLAGRNPAVPDDISGALRQWRESPFGRFSADSLTLMQSRLRPAGSIYSPLFTTPLGRRSPSPA
jgi:RNA 2',3'-cyclic 3'-phosphodiesterase